MAFKDDTQHADGLDYAGLQIGHLGAIYEALLSLKLSRAKEPLAYDIKRDLYRPQRSGENPTITRSELFYQTEKGGQKSGGVYYTRHEFVEHLLNNSLKPALENHLLKVRKTAQTDPSKAAQQLFNFSVLDPAMGSGHFLTVALDIIADRIDTFISEINGLPRHRSPAQPTAQTRRPTRNNSITQQPPRTSPTNRRRRPPAPTSTQKMHLRRRSITASRRNRQRNPMARLLCPRTSTLLSRQQPQTRRLTHRRCRPQHRRQHRSQGTHLRRQRCQTTTR